MCEMKVNNLKLANEMEALALSKQWTEYADIYMKRFSPLYHNIVLKDLNFTLSCQSFLGGNKICDADLIVFSILHDLMVQFTFQEKEKLVHLSRWYSAMQAINKDPGLIRFSRTLLY